MSSQYTGKLLGGSHQGCAGDFSHGNVVQLAREEVIINDKRVVALIDSGCSRSIVSSNIVSHLGLKPAMNHVVTMSGDKIQILAHKYDNICC